MTNLNQLVSIIIPVFNESESIGYLLDEVLNVMDTNKFKFEIVVVNDGSQDTTSNVLDELTLKIKELSVISLRKNYGQTAAMAAGFDKNAEVYNSLFKLGFGFVEAGTITPLKQYGNPKPRVFRLEKDRALINRLGFNNHGSEVVSQRISNNLPSGFLGINVGPNKDTKDRVKDYLVGLRKFHDIGDYLTVNISSPNTENLRNWMFENKDKSIFPKWFI